MFGTRFTFRTRNRDNYKTNLGGIFTILTFAIIALFSFFFGQDFYFGTNPTIYTNTLVPEKYDPPLHLTPENFVIAWRIENYQKVFTDVSGIIYPITYHFRLRRDAEGNMNLISNDTMPQVRCSEKNAKVLEFTNYNKIEDWFCYDWSNLNYTFGGFFDGDYLDAFQTVLFMCKGGVKYDASNPNCTKIEDYQSFDTKNGGLVMSIMYPEYYFSADDLIKPLKLVYKNYYYYFNIQTQKIDRLFFNKISVRDDQGWIFEDVRESSLLSFNRIQGDLNFAEIGNGSISRFYSFNIYMEKRSMVIKRSFMKIQDLSAKVGGLIKILMTLFAFLNSVFNFHSFQMEVFSELFQYPKKDLSDSDSSLKKKVGRLNIPVQGQKRNHFFLHHKYNSINKSIIIQNNFVSTNNKIIQGNVENSELNNILTKTNDKGHFSNLICEKDAKPHFKYLQVDEKLDESYEKSLMEKKKKFLQNASNLSTDSKPKNIDFGVLFMLSKCFFSSAKADSMIQRRRIKAYEFLIDYFNKRLDLINYFKRLNKSDLIYSFIFSDLQNKSFGLLEKPNVFNELEISLFEPNDDKEAVSDIIREYKEIIKNKSLDPFDYKLLMMLPDKIKFQIV